MATEVILLENVTKLGVVGDTVKVSDGYARNFLLPRSLAARVNKSVLRQIEAKKIVLQKQYDENLNIAKTLADKISAASVTITMEANEEDKLFGSVTARSIAESLKEQTDLEVQVSDILLADAIRELGRFTIEVALLPEVSAELKVWVVRDGQTETTTTEEAAPEATEEVVEAAE